MNCALCGKSYVQNASGSYAACCHIRDKRGVWHSVYWYRGRVYGALILAELGMKAVRPINSPDNTTLTCS